MPIYEYECLSCGIHFERQQRWNDAPVTACPECEGQVRKVLHPVGIVFKGTGFYKTDYCSTGNKEKEAEKEGKKEEA